MKIGLFSDIHSDVESLQKTLAFLRGQAVDAIYCLGDVVEMDRPNGDETVAAMQDIPTVSGNHDEFTLGRSARLAKQGKTEGLPKPETLAYLQNLPERLYFTWEGWRVMLYHGTWISLSPDSPDYLFAKAAQRIRETEVDILIMGHTHMPMNVRCGGLHFLNPGAVTARQGGVFCATLTLPEIQFQVWNVLSGQVHEIPILEIDDYLEDTTS